MTPHEKFPLERDYPTASPAKVPEAAGRGAP